MSTSRLSRFDHHNSRSVLCSMLFNDYHSLHIMWWNILSEYVNLFPLQNALNLLTLHSFWMVPARQTSRPGTDWNPSHAELQTHSVFTMTQHAWDWSRIRRNRNSSCDSMKRMIGTSFQISLTQWQPRMVHQTSNKLWPWRMINCFLLPPEWGLR